jgi:hypothetical protein
LDGFQAFPDVVNADVQTEGMEKADPFAGAAVRRFRSSIFLTEKRVASSGVSTAVSLPGNRALLSKCQDDFRIFYIFPGQTANNKSVSVRTFRGSVEEEMKNIDEELNVLKIEYLTEKTEGEKERNRIYGI